MRSGGDPGVAAGQLRPEAPRIVLVIALAAYVMVLAFPAGTLTDATYQAVLAGMSASNVATKTNPIAKNWSAKPPWGTNLSRFRLSESGMSPVVTSAMSPRVRGSPFSSRPRSSGPTPIVPHP